MSAEKKTYRDLPHQSATPADDFDYSYVYTPARVAVYDDMRSAPRILQISPAPTADYIEDLASTIYEQSQKTGGSIPYTAIREVTENFIHAQFTEIVVSILDKGNTIRFSDQGPGIPQKDKAQLPGFSSAIEPMKQYIRGVGSGLPLVKEYLSFSHGTISIEDNLTSGAVVTLSLQSEPSDTPTHTYISTTQQASDQTRTAPKTYIPELSDREKEILKFFASEGALGVTDIVNLTGYPTSSTHKSLTKLEEYGLIEKTAGKKRILTDIGYQATATL